VLNSKLFALLTVVALSSCKTSLASFSAIDLYNGLRSTMSGRNALPEIASEEFRELADGVYKFCATDFNPGRPRTHVMTNVNMAGTATVRWLNEGDFCVILNKNDDTLTFEGTVVPMDTATYGDVSISMEVVFSMSVMFDECYCATNLFPPNNQAPKNPNYGAVENQCTPQAYMMRPAEAENLLFCPKCEQNQCSKANNERNRNGAPKPIWEGWYFYTKVKGSLSGDGVPVFRKIAMESFPDLNPEITTCTLNIENLPLPQFFCSDLDDPNNGYGYGVNAKNQACGFATWFNCQEDVDDGTVDSKLHIADFNFDIEPCPTPNPTTSAPTPPTTPEPTVNPTTSSPTNPQCPTQKKSCTDFENMEGSNMCTTKEDCEMMPGYIFDTTEMGRGCSDMGGNIEDCGCCRKPPTPEPTPQPVPTTPQPTVSTCPLTKDSCKNFENSAGDNFCSTREDCEMTPGYIFDTDMMGLGCSGMGGNEDDCGCCRRPPTPEPTAAPTTPAPTEPDVCKWFNVTDEFCVNVSGIFCPDDE